MLRIAVVGLGKMGLSHFSIINSHPAVNVVAICDATGYVLEILNKYTGTKVYKDYKEMLVSEKLDAIVIATPSNHHGWMVEEALRSNIHVFCEKPFCLDTEEGAKLVDLAKQNKLVNQVGYHNRFVGAFAEVKRLLELKAIGEVTHVLAEAYGPVVLKPSGNSWRSQRSSGGGCLYDYAAHPLNLVNWYFGKPTAVGGAVLNSIFSSEIDDEVYGTLYFDKGMTAQLSVNWSDESHRKMSTKITIFGKNGKIVSDRQEVQVYLRDTATIPAGYQRGWNIKYTTDLTNQVWFYVRGEEYSAQLDYFVTAVKESRLDNINSFESALETDQVISMIISDANKGPSTGEIVTEVKQNKTKSFSFFRK
jgi:predicted dehydrogenase